MSHTYIVIHKSIADAYFLLRYGLHLLHFRYERTEYQDQVYTTVTSQFMS